MFRGFLSCWKMNLGVSVSLAACSLCSSLLHVHAASVQVRMGCFCPRSHIEGKYLLSHVCLWQAAMYGGDGNIFSGQLAFFSKKWLQIQVNSFFVILSDPLPFPPSPPLQNREKAPSLFF